MAEDKATDAKPEAAPRKGKLGAILGLVVVTLLAAGAGGGIGLKLASTVEHSVSAKVKAEAEAAALEKKPAPRYAGDMVVQPLKPVIANLASPATTWIRLETSLVYPSGAVENADATAAEVQQDILAYARTMSLADLQGPSALQHLRDDLNERVALRTQGQVSELVIQTMILQ